MNSPAPSMENDRLAARLRIVEEHVRCENQHSLPGIMATFGDEVSYEDAPWGERHAGRDAVEQYYRDLLRALPDLQIAVRNRVVTEDAVVLEVMISGTQGGSWRGLPATGRRVEFPLCAIYRFGPTGKLASEKIYYDRAGVLRQVGLYHEPVGAVGQFITALTHPVTIVGAYLRKVLPRSAA
ncbi:MAG TPA: ester cyclase [Gemmatimonadales bacterium]|nr:ester cyclase [Gemmatimonadales bacterium]